MTERKWSRLVEWGIPVCIFIAALAPRLPGLDRFLTTDEPFNLRQSAAVVDAVLQGNFAATYWHFYPGLTIAWLSGLGVLFQWLGSGAAEPFAQFIQRNVVELLIAARLPHAILGALFAVAVYGLVRRLLGHRVALVGALLIAWDPFLLAHTRVTHGDSPVAVFMGLGLLAYLAHLRDPATRQRLVGGDLVFSAVCGGLAALSKSPGHFIVPFIVLLGVGEALRCSAHAHRPLLWRRFIQLGIWCITAGAVFVVLWPALWVDPLGTLRRMLEETFDKMAAGHLVFFMGQPTLDPGPWFYPYVIAFRLTPVAWVGLGLAGVASVWMCLSRTRWSRNYEDLWTVGLTGLLVLSLLLLAELSPKKQDRYLLVLFPLLDLLAGWGIVRVGEWVADRRTSHPGRLILSVSSLWAGLIALHAYPVITHYPYYLAYFNPLMGGLPRAIETTLVGWGEGMEQVAAYLNVQPNAETAYVAAVPVQTLLPYFRGRGENFYTNDVALRADWVVLYVSQLQRRAPSPEIVRYFRAQQPEHVVELLGVPYAWVYRGPKLITYAPPVGLRRISGVSGEEMPLQLVGYHVEKRGGAAVVTLGWYAPARVAGDYTVSVRLVGADGRWLAQHDSWPAGGLLPTHQLRPGDYVRDVHVLELGAGARVRSVQVVIYDAARNMPLGAPIELALQDE